MKNLTKLSKKELIGKLVTGKDRSYARSLYKVVGRKNKGRIVMEFLAIGPWHCEKGLTYRGIPMSRVAQWREEGIESPDFITQNGTHTNMYRPATDEEIKMYKEIQ